MGTLGSGRYAPYAQRPHGRFVHHVEGHKLGMSNDKLALSVPGSLTLDASGIQKAFESAAAVRVLFVDDDTQITPWLLGVSGSAAVKNPDKVQSISSPK